MVIRHAVMIIATFATVPLCGDEVYFRHDFGISTAESPPLYFDDSTTRWKVPLKQGHSTPTIYEDQIFLTEFDPATQDHATLALDRSTGREQWRQVAPTTFTEQQHVIGSPASATVATDGVRVYAFFGSYGLLSYGLDGTPAWSKPLGPFQDEFGSSSSPVLVSGRLLLNEDHDINNYLLCLDAQSGDTLWQANRDSFTRSYATPTIWKHDGTTEVIVAGALQLTSYDLETGKVLWWVNGLARIVNTTPVVQGDRIIVATWSPGGDVGERINMSSWQEAQQQFDANGDNLIAREELQPGPVLTRFFRIDLNQDQGLDENEWKRHAQVFARAQNLVLAIRPRGRGDLTESAVLWRTPTGAPYVSSPVVHEGIVYLAKDGGIFTTIDLESGRVLRRARLRGRGNYYSSPMIVGNHVYIASQNGVLSVLAQGGNWGTVTTHDFGEQIYATPVFHGNQMYLRTDKHLYCFSQPSP